MRLDGTARFARPGRDAAADPGWCKLDWVIADPISGGVANASNVLDPTWEAPDGTIIPLDGYLDPYFQEVYLETDSIPLFSRLVKEMGADSVAEYVERLTDEVYKYTVKEPNYGKAARRMYNIFRLTGRYAEAAYIRELFDEPVTALYQVAALLRTLDEAADAGDTFETDAMVGQIDQLIMSAIAALEGSRRGGHGRRLLHLRDAISRRAAAAEDGRGHRRRARRRDACGQRVLRARPDGGTQHRVPTSKASRPRMEDIRHEAQDLRPMGIARHRGPVRRRRVLECRGDTAPPASSGDRTGDDGGSPTDCGVGGGGGQSRTVAASDAPTGAGEARATVVIGDQTYVFLPGQYGLCFDPGGRCHQRRGARRVISTRASAAPAPRS